ncbi:hypothetical protein C8R43DRAFT_530105 [Mycena crocata]|nr:hypothetical protein C8R43DRAFT_530105 [Mycena crocata]
MKTMFLFIDIVSGVKISPKPQNPPEGFLFFCPGKDFKIGADSVQWPDCPAYWSLDPLGIEHLSTQEAEVLGFPHVEPLITLKGSFWDASVYAGLRKFHEAKGFDPDSQDVARHLGYPLYELPDNIYVDVPFAHGV